MPYFVDNETLEVVYRKYELNAEAVDGRISLIDEDTLCIILFHVPNKKWGYDVYVSDKGIPSKCYDKLEVLNSSEKTTPRRFYALVTERDLEEYLKNEKYEFKEKLKEKKEVKKEVTVKETIKSIDKKPKPVKNPKSPNKTFGTSLVRDSQKPVHVFKSPSEKYS